MAKGRPDWTSSINITGQDLSEVISRPKYGGAQVASYSGVVAEDSDEILVTVAGTGMIYGGLIQHRGSFATHKVGVGTIVDGTEISYITIRNFSVLHLEYETMWFIYEKYYGVDDEIYIQGISRGVTFETSWALGVKNLSGSGDSDTITMQVVYALI